LTPLTVPVRVTVAPETTFFFDSLSVGLFAAVGVVNPAVGDHSARMGAVGPVPAAGASPVTSSGIVASAAAMRYEFRRVLSVVTAVSRSARMKWRHMPDVRP